VVQVQRSQLPDATQRDCDGREALQFSSDIAGTKKFMRSVIEVRVSHPSKTAKGGAAIKDKVLMERGRVGQPAREYRPRSSHWSNDLVILS